MSKRLHHARGEGCQSCPSRSYQAQTKGYLTSWKVPFMSFQILKLSLVKVLLHALSLLKLSSKAQSKVCGAHGVLAFQEV